MDDTDALAHLARIPAERAAAAVPWAGGAVWTAAEIMHWAAWPGMTFEAAAGAVAAFGIAFGISAHKGWGWRLPLVTAAFAAWLAIACARGPLDGFHAPPLTIVLAVLTAAMWKTALSHPSIREALAWRARRAEWLAVRHEWHLPGSHLLEHTQTWLGERFRIDVSESGRLASAIARSDLPERIATRRKLPRSRVRVSETGTAGEVVIDIRERDPWAKPIAHPLLDPEPPRPGTPETAAAAIESIRSGAPRTVLDPVPVGQDPATGALITVPLWDEDGGKNVTVVGIKGSGKTTLLHCLSEGVTAAADALMVRVNLSFKGHAEAERWGPASHLTALAPHQQSRAVLVLRAVLRVLEWRALKYATSQYVPGGGDPLMVVFVDESDAAMSVPGARRLLDEIATKGREYGASLVKAGTRGTVDYSSGKQRSQDDVFVLGKVNRATEAMHAAGDLGLRLPDMATYGEGKPGVWVVARLGSPGWQAGRAWNLSDPTDIAGIARERAHSQPVLPAECREFLGDEYAALLGSDVYARWARESSPATGDEPSLPRPRMTPLDPDGGEAASPVAVIDDNPTVRLDWDMDDDMKKRFAGLDEKIRRLKQDHAETAAMDTGPDVPQEKLREASEERRRAFAEDTVIPPAVRARLLDLLSGDGMSGRKITEILAAENPRNPPKRAWVMGWVNRLQWEGTAYAAGKGPAIRWRLTAERGDGE